MRKSFGPPTRTSRCRTVRVPALTECLPYALAILPGHSLQVLYTEGLRQDWPSPFRPREPLSPVAFPSGARRKAAVACRLFRQDRGSSQGVLTPPLGGKFHNINARETCVQKLYLPGNPRQHTRISSRPLQGTTGDRYRWAEANWGTSSKQVL